VASVILQSVNGTQTELQISGGENLNPFLLNPTLCANVVLKVSFVIMYNPAGEIANVTLSVVLGFVREDALPLQQEFHIKFVQEEVTVHYSGNPGYVVGLPLVAGTRTAEYPSYTLSLLRSTEDQVCLQGQHQRSPVLFDVDYVSGCTLRLEDVDNCSLVSQTLLNILRGAKYPQYVASFGNSPLDSTLDWVPIQSNFNLGVKIEWTKYGSLVNPHAQIVSKCEDFGVMEWGELIRTFKLAEAGTTTSPATSASEINYLMPDLNCPPFGSSAKSLWTID
uniref:Tectonic-1-3 domain-containing protein n=1 Tax=Mola mola TaxID=94237 RepID=A0A3Q3VKK7_MOLML